MHKALGQALLGCAIPAPLRLLKDTAAAPVQCAVDLAAGGLEVLSGATGRHLAHLRASASRVLVSPLTAAAAPQQQPAGLSIFISLVAVHVTATQPARLPAATAGIALRPAEHASGYLAHPAVVDSMLHIGAALAAALQRQGAAPETRVPTAIGAFGPCMELCGAPGAWACAAVTGQLPDGSAASSYRLAADAAQGSVVTLAEMQAKALDQAQSAAASPGKENVAPHLLYNLAWQSSLPIMRTGQRVVPLRTHQWIGASTGMRVPGHRRHVPAHASAACLADMAVLQRAMAERACTGLSLVTSGAQQQGESVCAASWRAGDAAAWGLVRVAASERPALAWAAVDVQPVTAARASCALPTTDAFGAVIASGAVAMPRILASLQEDMSQQGHEHPCASTGRTVISGGLGGDVPFVSLTAILGILSPQCRVSLAICCMLCPVHAA